jgi:hypothetical protein
MNRSPIKEPYTEDPNYQIYEGESGNFGLNPERSEFVRSQGLKSKVIAKERITQAKALENRIALLEQQEREMLKKIEETKGKAQKVLNIKKRNRGNKQEKMSLKRQRELELQKRKEQIRKTKEERRNKLRQIKEQQRNKNRMKVQEVKQEMSVLKTRQRSELRDQQIKNMKTIDNIRKFEKSLMEKKQERLESIKDQSRNRMFFKMAKNATKAQNNETKIEMLERKERELMDRLQKTQALHKEALETVDMIVEN